MDENELKEERMIEREKERERVGGEKERREKES